MRGACLVLGLLAAVFPALGGDGSCRECHWEVATRADTHPVGIPAPARLAGRLPTDEGLITCRTCHEPHGLARPAAQGAGRYALRLPAPDLCALCHRDAAGRWDHPHTTYADALHGGTQLALAPGSGDLDPVSERCLGCHDGGMGPDAPHTTAVTGRLGVSHPIGVALVRPGRPLRQMHDPYEVESRGVRLYEGRVGCGSCHRLFGHRNARVAVEMERSRLCFACHAL
ncbi:MAG: hypothetical protein D6718_05845 [Acidobacteria bacterium]|nr:MAG: hypothetical protein D6718_05845 [Acidobacteriota bacterium]